MSAPAAALIAPIAVDARFVHEGGVDRYTSELVWALGDQTSSRPFCVYVPSTDYAKRLRLPRRGWAAVILPTRTYHPGEQWVLCRQLWRDAPALLHSMNYWVVPLLTTVRLVVTVHDVLFQAGPELISRTARAYAWIMIRRALRRATRIITVSRFIRDEIIRCWPEVATKIVAVPSGVGKQFRPVRDPETLADLRARYELPPHFLLYVGSAKRHKNLITLIKAYTLLPPSLRIRNALLLVCKEDPRNAEIAALVRAFGLNEQVLWRRVMLDQDLPGLYSLATAFVLPSFCEGFGLPILEAMACGTPTLAARSGALPEVGADASIYTDPIDPAAMAESLRRLVEDSRLRDDLRERGLARATEFTWERTAQAVRSVYDDALAEVAAR